MSEANVTTTAGQITISKQLLADSGRLQVAIDEGIHRAFDPNQPPPRKPTIPAGHVLVSEDYSTQEWYEAEWSGHVIPQALWDEYQAASERLADVAERIEAHPWARPS